jgi:hypothetical protein
VDADAFSEAQPDNSPRLCHSKRKFDPKKGEHRLMTEEDSLICTDEVAGYSLDEKRWGFFKVDFIQYVDFDDHAFDLLEIDPRSKRVISSIMMHRIFMGPIGDFVKGKGKGMVVLLHGESGVGKTLAAGIMSPIAPPNADSRLTTLSSEHRREISDAPFKN